MNNPLCHVALCMMLTTLFALPISAAEPAPPQLVSEKGSERSTTGPGNNIVTRDGKTHVVWQECGPQGYYDAVRTLDRASGKWSDTVRIGPAKDNHARPCIAADSKGFLHVVIGGHGTMMYYYKSKAANDSSAWEKAEPIDIGTYPMLLCGGGDDTLVLAARHDQEQRGLNLFVKKPGGKWETRDRVFWRQAKNRGYSGFNAALAWGADGKRLHLAADIYESGTSTPTTGIYQSMIYMVSDDLGLTWKRADGSDIRAKPDTTMLDVIATVEYKNPKTKPPIATRNGGLVVDDKDRPCIFFLHRENNVTKLRLVTPDEKGKWKDLPVDEAFRKAWPNTAPGGFRGSLSRTDDGAMHMLVQLGPQQARVDKDGDDDDESEPAAGGDEKNLNWGMGLLTTRDGGATFQARTLFERDPARKVNLSNLERQTGHNDLRGREPALLFMDGLQRYPAKGEVINTKVYYLQP